MQTILLQINNDKAYQLLKDLEDLKIIKVLKQSTDIEQVPLSEKFAGSLKLSEDEYKEFQEYLTEVRNEWDRNI
ncbi:hypothetical protein FW774_03835 (plasmid) [Pedobacter sp. BS3]|uniref:hypothetical protein n=1 Tax=Pedobacter sp. BS3 TaxID=2567937 RepID=UPI0011EEC047|nr:hypothetical protein [Pedobacter sp. BS3]TZF86191.1 hypothetical protein FW774_03835 [Pedobacter sp. BS3]